MSAASSRTWGTLASAMAFLAMAGAGVLVLLFFFNRLYLAGKLGALSLPVVAVVGGVAATFNPCGLPALPGFFAVGAGDASTVRRSQLSLAAGLGAMSVVLILGVLVAALGLEVQILVAPHFRWVQLAAGVLLATIAVLHLTRQTERLPLVGTLTAAGARVWEKAVRRPTPLGAYLFGAGFVAVGGG